MSTIQFNVSRITPLFEYIKKQREIEKNRQIFELFTTFVLISFFLVVAIQPTIFTISNLVGDIKSKELLTTNIKNKIDQIINAQDKFASIQEKYYLIEDALPSSQNFADAFSQIDSLSSRNNIVLEKVNFIQSDKNYFSTQISTSSSFSSSLDLVSSLLQNRRIFDISQISLFQDKNSQSMNRINFSLPIDIFFWNNENEKK